METTSKSKRINIGIIGAGQIGGTLARKLTTLGHQVRVANSRGPASLEALANETGARAVTVEDAVHEVELVIVAIPEKSVPALPKRLFDRASKDLVIVDTGNYYPTYRDGRIEAIERAPTESSWVASVLAHPVVKCFNNILAATLAEGGRPAGAKDRIALPVAGDSARAKSTVMALLDDLGFDSVDGGGLEDSWRQQPGTPVYCTDFDIDGVRRALAMADRARAPQLRDLWIEKIRQLPAGTTPREMALMLREVQGATAR